MANRNKRLTQAIQKAKDKALLQVASYLDARFTEEISAVKWTYPTPPQVRDIVDTGRLRASQTRIVNSDGSITFSWPLEYASQVHEGGVSTDGLRFPGRPWTKLPLEEIPQKFDQFFQHALEEQT
jgi:hypothetical protein